MSTDDRSVEAPALHQTGDNPSPNCKFEPCLSFRQFFGNNDYVALNFPYGFQITSLNVHPAPSVFLSIDIIIFAHIISIL